MSWSYFMVAILTALIQGAIYIAPHSSPIWQWVAIKCAGGCAVLLRVAGSLIEAYRDWRIKTPARIALGRIPCSTLNWDEHPNCYSPRFYSEMVLLLSVLCCFAIATIFTVYTTVKIYSYKVVDADKRPLLRWLRIMCAFAFLIVAHYLFPALAYAAVSWWATSLAYSGYNTTPYTLPCVKVKEEENFLDPWYSPSILVAARKLGAKEQKEMACPGVESIPTSMEKLSYTFLICTPKWGEVIGMGFRISIEGRDRLVTALHVYEAAMDRSDKLWIAGKSGRVCFKPTLTMRTKQLDYVYLESPANQLSSAGITKATHCVSSMGLPTSVVSPPTDESELVMYSSCAMPAPRGAFKVSYRANTIKGSSGSPLYTSKGVFGVHTGCNGDYDDPRNFGSVLVTCKDLLTISQKSDKKETAAPLLRGAAHHDFNLVYNIEDGSVSEEDLIDFVGSDMYEFEESGNVYLPTAGNRVGRPVSYEEPIDWDTIRRLTRTSRKVNFGSDTSSQFSRENANPPFKTPMAGASGARLAAFPPSTPDGASSKTAVPSLKSSSTLSSSMTSALRKSEIPESARPVSNSQQLDLSLDADLLQIISLLLERQRQSPNSQNGPHQTAVLEQKQHPSGTKPVLSKAATSLPKRSPRTSSTGCSDTTLSATKPTKMVTSKVGAGKTK